MSTVFIQSGLSVRVFATFDTAREAFNCYQDLREHYHFNADEFVFVESGWFIAT